MKLFCMTNVTLQHVCLDVRCPLKKWGYCVCQLKVIMIVYLFATENMIKNHILLRSIISVVVRTAAVLGNSSNLSYDLVKYDKNILQQAFVRRRV